MRHNYSRNLFVKLLPKIIPENHSNYFFKIIYQKYISENYYISKLYSKLFFFNIIIPQNYFGKIGKVIS